MSIDIICLFVSICRVNYGLFTAEQKNEILLVEGSETKSFEGFFFASFKLFFLKTDLA